MRRLVKKARVRLILALVRSKRVLRLVRCIRVVIALMFGFLVMSCWNRPKVSYRLLVLTLMVRFVRLMNRLVVNICLVVRF